ncbi:MAG: alpha-hydroxy acid oxidase [Actinomycetota bacterium]
MSIFKTLRSVLRFAPREGDRITRKLAKTGDVEDLRKMAMRRLPRGVFDYIDGAAEDEITLAKNSQDFRDLTFRPRVLRDVSTIDSTTNVLGKPVPFPLILSPTGFTRIATPGGELDVARAAAAKNIPYTLSTLGTRSIEEVAAVSDGRKWFQVYVWKDRGLVKDMLDRAAGCGYEAIMITVDTAVLGRRERDVRRGFTLPPKIGLSTLIDGALHPAWTWAFVRSEPILFANVVGLGGTVDGSTAVSLAEHVNAQFDPSLSWADIEWMRANWSGPVIIKGIQTVEDAKIAVEHGIDAIALSNHGGRQLDTAPTPISLVEPVAQAVGGRTEIYCDGGVRRGSDIVKAVALGATACMTGRTYLYALGAAGEKGVSFVIDQLHAATKRTMALVGAGRVSELTPELIERAR